MASRSVSPPALWKGKARATESDYEDLDPVITYRHLHSHNLGVKDPLRVIALCDSDAFYALTLGGNAPSSLHGSTAKFYVGRHVLLLPKFFSYHGSSVQLEGFTCMIFQIHMFANLVY